MSKLPVRQQNALAAFAFPQRTLDEEMQSLIARYGSDLVRDSTKRLTKKRKGRKQELDWVKLKDVLQADAIDYLDGKNPFEQRTNYSIANEFADRNPGHNSTATHRRIMRKLSQRRQFYFMIRAWEHCEENRPFGDYFRVVEEFSAVDPKWSANLLKWSDFRRGQLMRYRDTIGEPVSSMTLADISLALSQLSIINAAPMKVTSRGLLAALASPVPISSSSVENDGK